MICSFAALSRFGIGIKNSAIIRGKIFASLCEAGGRQGKKRKEELHKLLSMKPLCPFSAGFYFFGNLH